MTTALAGMKQAGWKFWSLWGLMYAFALVAAGNALLFMTVDGWGGRDFAANFGSAPALAWAHMTGGMVAILLGPFQFLTRLRARRPRLHRWTGYVYFACVFTSASAGFYFATISVIGPVSGAAFVGMGIAWVVTATMAIVMIRRRRIDDHRRWMVRNYAVTFAAATLRAELGLLIAAGLAFPLAFKIVAWLSWTGNLVVAERLFNRPRGKAMSDHRLSDSDLAFRTAFERGEIAPVDFSHRNHVRLAYTYLVGRTDDDAHAAMRSAIVAFLERNGVDAAKYHETITKAWILAIRHFMQKAPGCGSADELIARQPQLLDSKIMLTHYSAELLFSPAARARFVEPDVDPIPRY